MARLWSTGLELNTTTTSNVEFLTDNSGSLPTITTSNVRSGTYAHSFASFAASTRQTSSFQFLAASGNGPYWFRLYIYVSAYPTNNPLFMSFATSQGVQNARVGIRMSSAGVLDLVHGASSIGTSSALSLNTYYRIELKFDNTGGAGAGIVEGKIDGTTFASSTTQTFAGGTHFIAWGREAVAGTTGAWNVDDIAVNDNTGGAQASWPGDGKIVHLHPDGAGDSAADSGTFADIDEVTPNDATDFINLDTATSVADYTCEASSVPGIGSTDTVSLVAVGIRIREEVSVSTSYRLRLKSASGGTTSTSVATDAGNTTWRTNPNITTSFTHTLISYTDPTTTVAWTPTGTNSLDNMQIGVASLDVDNIDVSTLWALVEYVPAAGGYAGDIKKLSGVLQASQKKVSGVAQAAIKKVSGVSNV